MRRANSGRARLPRPFEWLTSRRPVDNVDRFGCSIWPSYGGGGGGAAVAATADVGRPAGPPGARH